MLLVGILSMLAWVRGMEPAVTTDDGEEFFVPVGRDLSSMLVASMLVPELTAEVRYSIGPIVGRVTALGATGQVHSGDILLAVDGRDRPLLISDSPLWRPLRWATEGPDVAAVSDFLAELGYLDLGERSDRVDAPFVGGVRAFETELGWPRTGVFRPEYVVWFPFGSQEISTFELSLGEIVQAEATVAVQSPDVRSAQAVRRDGSPLTLADVGPGWEFAVVDGPVVRLDRNGSVTGDLDALAGLVDQESGTIAGVTRLRAPVEWQTVPAASVVADSEGTTCVVTPGGDTLPITVIGSSLGVTRIAPTLPEGTIVAVAPNPPSGRCA